MSSALLTRCPARRGAAQRGYGQKPARGDSGVKESLVVEHHMITFPTSSTSSLA